MFSKFSMKVVLVFLVSASFFFCDKMGGTEGYFINDDIYEVIAYGKANAQAKFPVQKHSQAKEAALTAAQNKILETFALNQNFLKGGVIIKEEFISESVCKITYRVGRKNLRSLLRKSETNR